ncbi:MAG: hypothetical protein GY810_22790 [Aureispira sp.]|nr:hypothetical protein [Aureispira sp.]
MNTPISKMKHFIYFTIILFFCSSYNNNLISQKTEVIGTVNGEEITREQLLSFMEELEDSHFLPEEIQKYAWEQLTTEVLIAQLSKNIEIDVSPAEMGELFLGENMSPIVRGQFTNRQTGETNRELIKQIIEVTEQSDYSQYSEEHQEQLKSMKKAWNTLKARVKHKQLVNKLFTIYGQGTYIPKWMAKSEIQRNNISFNLKYVHIPYSNIPKSSIEVSKQEVQEYLEQNIKLYQGPATVGIEYIRFPVEPSAADSLAYLEEMTALANEFKETDNDSLFILRNFGEIDPQFYTKEEMRHEGPDDITDALFKAKKGEIIGPYISTKKEYKVIKVLDNIILPDSVRSSHILRRLHLDLNHEESTAEAYRFLDSLRKAIIAKKISFADAAKKHGQDATIHTGGDLGFHAKDGTFVPKFENHLFSGKEKGNLEIVQTQFGLHLVQITDQKFETNAKAIRIAYISTPLIGSEQTTANTDQRAKNFIKENTTLKSFRTAADQLKLPIYTANGLEENSYEILGLTKGSSCAEIIKWAYTSAKVGDVSNRIYYLEDPELNIITEFIVPVLIYKDKENVPSLNNPSIYAEIEHTIGKQKKLEVVKKEIGTISNLATIASKYSTKLATTSQPISYNNFRLGYSNEPKVLGVAATLKEGQQSKPILGNEGVYIIELISKKSPNNLDQEIHKSQLKQRISMVINPSLFDALKKEANIKDFRTKSYTSKKSPLEEIKEDSPSERNASEAVYTAQLNLELDSLALALNGIKNGHNQFLGFSSIITKYAGTKTANLAHYYAGVCRLNLGQYSQALELLSAYQPKDLNLKALTLSLIGDIYSELGKFNKSLEHYNKAANLVDNEAITPYFLYKAGLLNEVEQKNVKKAKEYYLKIQKNYPYLAEKLFIENCLIRITDKY